MRTAYIFGTDLTMKNCALTQNRMDLVSEIAAERTLSTITVVKVRHWKYMHVFLLTLCSIQ